MLDTARKIVIKYTMYSITCGMAANMNIDLKWIIGQRIKDMGNQDYTWFFDVDGGRRGRCRDEHDSENIR